MQKPIQADEFSHTIIKCEAARQSVKKTETITMGNVLNQLAVQLNKKHKFIRVGGKRK